MQAIGKFLDSHLASVRKLVKIIIISIFALQVLVVFSQVVWRFIFNNPFSWSEELARYFQVWLILLMSSVCIRKGKHLAIDYMTHALPYMYNKILKYIIMVFIMFFTGIVIIFGIHMIVVTINQKTPALHIPILVVYLAFPIAGLLMFLEALILFLKLAGTKNEADLEALHSK
ncbi:MAG: TRAP transporter small permease [Spirochaetes bacterium]|nr:TRAP transporter small permease [Spirochaetota bacterium]